MQLAKRVKGTTSKVFYFTSTRTGFSSRERKIICKTGLYQYPIIFKCTGQHYLGSSYMKRFSVSNAVISAFATQQSTEFAVDYNVCVNGNEIALHASLSTPGRISAIA